MITGLTIDNVIKILIKMEYVADNRNFDNFLKEHGMELTVSQQNPALFDLHFDTNDNALMFRIKYGEYMCLKVLL